MFLQNMTKVIWKNLRNVKKESWVSDGYYRSVRSFLTIIFQIYISICGFLHLWLAKSNKKIFGNSKYYCFELLINSPKMDIA